LNGTYSTIATLPANTTTYTNTGLTKGKKYYYRVRAVNSAGNSAWSNTAFSTATCNITTKSGELIQSNDVKQEGISESIILYPNPVTDGEFYLNLPDITLFPALLQIFSMTGQKVMQMELYDCSNTIKTGGLKNGLYILTVMINGKVQNLKLQINN
jgi:hypothetical protein